MSLNCARVVLSTVLSRQRANALNLFEATLAQINGFPAGYKTQMGYELPIA